MNYDENPLNNVHKRMQVLPVNGGSVGGQFPLLKGPQEQTEGDRLILPQLVLWVQNFDPRNCPSGLVFG